MDALLRAFTESNSFLVSIFYVFTFAFALFTLFFIKKLFEILVLLKKFFFLEYIILFKKINIKTKGIKILKNWFKPKSICNIYIFSDFTNFYWQFI